MRIRGTMLRCSAIAWLTLVVILPLPLATAAGEPHAGAWRNSPEAALVRTFESLEQSRLGAALAEVDRVIAERPNFRLAHLVRGDLLLARTRPIEALGNTGHAARERLDGLRAEAYARLRAHREPPPADLVPRNLVQLAAAQKHAVVVDAGRSRVYVLENGPRGARVVADYYATLGRRGTEKLREGDQKTPIGVYFVTSVIPGSKLPDLYGWGAFPINYPNEWDRLAGRTGYGIWLHGVPSDTFARAPWVSDGCIALANPDIEALGMHLQAGVTPVVIAERIEWVAPEALQAERDLFMRQLEAWIADWKSLDGERYLEHYSRGFRSEGMDLAAWQAHKRRVNAAKSWIKLSLTNVSVFRHPGSREDLVTVTFDQDYRSSNLAQRTRKRQYWVAEGGRWKIAYEAPVGGAKLALPESFPASRR